MNKNLHNRCFTELEMRCEEGIHPINYNTLRVAIYRIQETVKGPNAPLPEFSLFHLESDDTAT